MADGGRFDVLEAMDGLKAAGFSDGQARTLADTFQHIASARQADLATKADVELSAAALKSDIAALRTELKTDIAALRTELKTDIAALRTELKTETAALRAEHAEFRAEMKRDVAELETRLLKAMSDQQRWTIGIAFTIAGLLFAALKLL